MHNVEHKFKKPKLAEITYILCVNYMTKYYGTALRLFSTMMDQYSKIHPSLPQKYLWRGKLASNHLQWCNQL